jgi:hypothetical protein
LGVCLRLKKQKKKNPVFIRVVAISNRQVLLVKPSGSVGLTVNFALDIDGISVIV